MNWKGESQRILCLCVLLITFLGSSIGQTGQEKLDRDFEKLNGSMDEMFGEMAKALKEAQGLFKSEDYFKKLDDGQLRFDGDTLNIDGIFQQLLSLTDRMPEQLRPDDWQREGLNDLGKKFPEIMEENLKMLRNFNFDNPMGLLEEMDPNPAPKQKGKATPKTETKPKKKMKITTRKSYKM